MIQKTAQAGSLESSDCLVTVSPADEFSLEYKGNNEGIFGKRTCEIVKDTLAKYDEKNVRVLIQDQGALEVTLRARIEVALERAAK